MRTVLVVMFISLMSLFIISFIVSMFLSHFPRVCSLIENKIIRRIEKMDAYNEIKRMVNK